VTQRIAELRQTQAQLRELARRTAEVDPADCTRYCIAITNFAQPAVQMTS
jgi:hypothetical protein